MGKNKEKGPTSQNATSSACSLWEVGPSERLALRELRSFTSLFETVLLAFYFT
jgi:hypothetical protein